MEKKKVATFALTLAMLIVASTMASSKEAKSIGAAAASAFCKAKIKACQDCQPPSDGACAAKCVNARRCFDPPAK